MATDLLELTGGNDVIFKGVMYEHKKVFKCILELVLKTKINNITYLSPELPVRRFLEKGKRLDVYIDTIDSLVDIEVSTDYDKEILNRNLSFGFSLYCQKVKRGDGYDEYVPVKIINLIFNKRSDKPHKEGYLVDEETGKVITKMLQYSEYYIENYLDMYYNGEEENIKKNKYLIMLGLNLEKLEKFNEEYGDDIVAEYTKSFREMLLAEPFEPLFDREEDQRRIMNTKIRKAEKLATKRGLSKGFKQGISQGIEQGIEQGISRGIEQGRSSEKQELAKKFKDKGVDVNIISEATGLSLSELKSL